MTVLALRNGTVNVNDIFVSKFGWEQTNVCFYQVISTHGKKTVVVREVRGLCESESSMSGKKTAILNDFIGEPMKRQLRDFSDRPCIKIEDYEIAYKTELSKKHSYTSYA